MVAAVYSISSNVSSYAYKSFSLNKKNICFNAPSGNSSNANTIKYNRSTSDTSTATFICDVSNKLVSIDEQVRKNILRLDEIKSLPEDWNGYGASTFSLSLIEKCKEIVNTLSHQPKIYPTGRNSIQFQYELEDKSYLEFEIFENMVMCLCVPQRVYANAITKNITNSEQENIKKIVNEFYGNCSATR